MGKSLILDKSTRKKNLKATKKTSNTLQNHTFDVDSLNCFKQKTSENIDDKFKLLKSELHSLFQTSKAEASESLPSNHAQSNLITENCDKLEKHQSPNNSVSPNPSKFSEWLSDTIEKMETDSLNSGINKRLECDELLPPTAKMGLKSKYNMTLLPNYKVEQLLYKSFQLQNLGIYVPSSCDESEAEQLKSSKVRKQKKRRSRKPSTRSFSSFSKRRKTAPFNNDMEIMNSKGLKKGSNERVDFAALDIDSYDWNEPFHIKSSENSSVLEIIEGDPGEVNLNEERQNNAEDLKENCITNAQEECSNKNFIGADAKKTMWECPICFEPSQGQSIVATQCGHVFCKTCLEEHKSAHGKLCPTCRLNLNGKPFITLFNI